MYSSTTGAVKKFMPSNVGSINRMKRVSQPTIMKCTILATEIGREHVYFVDYS
uniref:Uncharacterized protein n=1 Tax=Tetranychus urticae TaxID=32264 RepID=T1KFE9_TETUR